MKGMQAWPTARPNTRPDSPYSNVWFLHGPRPSDITLPVALRSKGAFATFSGFCLVFWGHLFPEKPQRHGESSVSGAPGIVRSPAQNSAQVPVAAGVDTWLRDPAFCADPLGRPAGGGVGV